MYCICIIYVFAYPAVEDRMVVYRALGIPIEPIRHKKKEFLRWLISAPDHSLLYLVDLLYSRTRKYRAVHSMYHRWLLFKDTGRGRTRTGRHTQNADRGRATPHTGTNPHTGQNRGQDTPGSDQEQNGRAQKQPRDPSNRRKSHKQPVTVPGNTIR